MYSKLRWGSKRQSRKKNFWEKTEMLIQMNLLIWEFLKSYLLFLFSHSVMPTLWEPWTTAQQASLSFTIFQSLLKLMSIESVMPSNHLILCLPLFLLPSIFPSIRVFSNESVLHMRWPKYWSFSFSISPSNEYSRLISFKIDWFDLFALQGLFSVFSSTIAQRHQFFGAQPFLLSSSHIPTWLLEKP